MREEEKSMEEGKRRSARAMTYKTRRLWFWGKLILEAFGISAAIAGVCLLVSAMGGLALDETRGVLWEGLLRFPVYLWLCGAFCISVLTLSLFQSYANAMIAVTATRRSVTAAILLQAAVEVLLITAAMAVIWSFVPSPEERSHLLSYVMPACGVLFVVAAVFVIMGALSCRFGKIGLIIAMVLYALLGAAAGFMAAMTSGGDEPMFVGSLLAGEFVNMAIQYGWVVLVGSLLFYGVSSAAAMMMMRRMEVRL